MKRFNRSRHLGTLLLVAMALGTTTQISAAQKTTTEKRSDYLKICSELPAQKLQHPYLVFSEADKPAMLQRIETDPRSAAIYRMLTLEGERYMRVDAAPQPAMNDVRSRFIGKDDHLTYQLYHQRGALLLALIYQLTGEEKYARRAYQMAEKLCAMDAWRQSVDYFETSYHRVWPTGVKDDQVAFTFDITAGDCAADVALVYDWIYPTLEREQRDRLRSGLLEQAILRVRGNYDYHWWTTAYKCNWSGICFNGLGMAALALLNEDPQLTDILIRSYEGIEGMLSNITTEGAWEEGRHYSVYGLCQSMMFMDAIKRLSKGKLNLFMIPGVKNAPADFALFSMTGNFNDGTFMDKGIGGPIGSPGMYGKLAAETGNTTAMYYIQTFLNRPNALFGGIRNNATNTIWDLIWPMPTDIPAVKPAEASKYFPVLDWAFLRKDFGDEYLQVATKCGPLNDPHHGHLDAGTFNLTWKGESIIGEFSQKFYDMFIFDDCRWEYLNTRSLGHNVVLVNGEEQITAKRKNQPWKEGIGGKITSFASQPEFAYTQMDATNAYDGKHLKGWTRTLILDKVNNIVVALDRIQAEPGAQIDLLFHPNVEALPAQDGQSASLTGEKSRMILQPLCNTATLKVTKQNQLYHRLVTTAPYEWIPCLYTTLRAEKSETIVGTLFYPTGDDQPAARSIMLDESGKNPLIRYTVAGKNYTYEISKSGVKSH